MNKKLGVAAGTSGPGGTNMLTSVGQAKGSYAPVLFITGCPSIRDTGKALGQDSTFFGTDLIEIYKHLTKFSARVERADLFESYFRHALEKMYYGVKGPVHLSIPYDVFNEQIKEFELDLPIDRPLISPDLDLFFDKLENAKRPAILAGKGVHASQAYNELLQLAEIWNIPVMTTPGGKGVFIENHSLSLGALGLGGTDESEKYVQEGIDLLIVIGSKLSDMSIIGLTPFPKEVIHLDYDLTFIQKSLLITTLPIIGDIKTNLNVLLNKVKDKKKSEYYRLNSKCEMFEDSSSYISSRNAIKL
jgi:acetolactate synthase-1/2/3 large subunit